MYLNEVFLFAISLSASLAAIIVMRMPQFSKLLVDYPNNRSLHISPKPRIGGIAIAFAIALVTGIWTTANSEMPVLIFSLAVLFLLSVTDDFRPLSALFRLSVQVAAATLVVSMFPRETFNTYNNTTVPTVFPFFSPIQLTFAIIAIVWMANLFNFMDGADGLAGGMAAFGFSAMAIQANLSSSPMSHIGEFATVLAGASTGFLFFNFPPAKIFMGDSGSIPVGFAAAVLAIYGYAEDIWPLWFPALVFSPFIVDASVTLVIRLFNFKNLLQPHREHLYQRLILSGWSHRKTAFGYYFLMLASSLSALVAIKMKLAEQTLIFWGVTYVALVGIANWRLSRNK